MAATIQYGNIATFTVLINGSAVPDEFRILTINTEQGVNRIASAKIVILDGEPDTQTFPASSSSLFVPGNAITIQAGYDGTNQTIFTGIITRQAIRIDSTIGSALEVECHDEAIRMTVGRKSRSFTNQKDSDTISSIIGAYGISSDLTPTTALMPEQVQYYVTDWDFIMTLAENNGLIVTTLNNKISIFKPDADTTPVLTVGYGINLLEFNAVLDAVSQLGNVKANTWDFKTQAVTSSQAETSHTGPGNLSSKTLSKVIGLDNYILQTPAPVQTDSLNTWCNAQLVKSDYAKILGEAKFQGTSLAVPGKYITMTGLGDRFNGDHIISRVEHTINDGNWLTNVGLGIPCSWFIEQHNSMALPASGLNTGISGLFTGTVRNIHQDPDSQYRVQVNIALAGSETLLWARLANLYATSGAGTFFFPEVGDEVVLGFLNEDARYPVLLGSLYSNQKNQPFAGLAPNEHNSLKAITSKSGISIQFDDQNKICTVTTPGNNTVVLSDKDKQVSLKDQNGNSFVMSESGIAIKSSKGISIEADETITVNGSQGIKVKSSGGDIETSGINIRQTADMQFSAQGSEMASISAGMELKLTGAMVMIN